MFKNCIGWAVAYRCVKFVSSNIKLCALLVVAVFALFMSIPSDPVVEKSPDTAHVKYPTVYIQAEESNVWVPPSKPTKAEARLVRYEKPSKPSDVQTLYWDGHTRISKSVLHKHINDVMRCLPHIKNTADFHRLMYETALAETDRGKYSVNCKNKDDLGMFQMRLDTTKETLAWLKYVHPDVYKVVDSFRDKKLSLKDDLLTNVTFGVAIAATYYWRRNPTPVLASVEDRGRFWKRDYNSSLGKGTVAHYMQQAKLNVHK